jgi:putative DNA-invertase from lambdoid prophage Rac
MIHIYLRVSTDDQDSNSQRLGVQQWLDQVGNPPALWHADTASGATSWKGRALADILKQASKGDTLVTPEISRIGRSTLDVLEFFSAAQEAGLTVIITKSGLTLDDSIGSRITRTILALAAEIEREMLLARTMEGLARAKAQGVRLGRPEGSWSESKCEKHRDTIIKLLKVSAPHTVIARAIGVHRHTLTRYIARMQSAT